jgi:hypothetical protein
MNVNKFPLNTPLWIIRKHETDPTYLPKLLLQHNYDAFRTKFKTNINCDSDVDESKFVGFIWKSLNELAEMSSDPGTKRFSISIVEHLRKEWKKRKRSIYDRSIISS